MDIKLEQYNEGLLHDDLTPIEELFLLYYCRNYTGGPFTSRDIIYDLGMTEQYVRRVGKKLEAKGYIIVANRSMDLVVSKINTELIPTDFLDTDSYTTSDKKTIISIYKQCVGKSFIEFDTLKLDISKDDAKDLFERLFDAGFSGKDCTFDFNRLFKNNSIYDI